MKKIRPLSTVAAVALLSVSLWAVPAKRITRSVTQSDGSVIQVTLVGDEFCHYFITEDSIPVREGEDGFFYYIEGDSLHLSTMEAHPSARRSEAEKKFLQRNTDSVKIHIRNFIKKRRERHPGFGRRRALGIDTLSTDTTASVTQRAASQSSALQGQKRVLVLLVEYSDKSMIHTQQEFSDMLNQEGYSVNGSVGSARDYFLDQSGELLDLQFDVVGPYTLSNNMAYYGKNNYSSYDTNVGTMVKEACTLAKGDVDFSKYDWDGDGIVDALFIYYAGFSESEGASTNTVWPHSSTLVNESGSAIRLNGYTINSYSCSSELRGTSGQQMSGIGTLCHEFSHQMGLPDTYDVSSNSGYGMQSWDLMHSGNYNQKGYVPPCYTAMERYYFGWLTPKEPETLVTDMKSLSESQEAYILRNDAYSNEFYLLENRQPIKWDSSLEGHGLLITYVDYNATTWSNNKLNTNSSHQCYTVVPADNNTNKTTVAGDIYPGTSGNSSFTNTSTPAATLYYKNSDGTKYLNKPIYNICEEDGRISFSYMVEPTIPTPEVLSADEIRANSFVAHWNAVDEAEEYEVELSIALPDTSVVSLISEDFSNFPSGSLIPVNVTSNLDQYTQTTGWSGQNVFVRNGYVLIGSSGVNGWLQTPICESETQLYSLTIEVTPYSSGISNTYTVYAVDEDGNKLAEISFVASEATTKNLLASVTKPCAFRIVPANRSYITKVEVRASKDGSTDEDNIVGLFYTTDTEYFFDALTEKQYYYRVKSISGNVQSEWSDYISVPIGLKGDADGNGIVTVGDITAVASYILNNSDIQTEAADMDEDGAITVSDITSIASTILTKEQ